MRVTFRSLVLVAVIQATSFGTATAAQVGDIQFRDVQARNAHVRAAALAGYEPGTIVIKTSERRLYYVLENGQTVSYPVAVGKAGKTWTGVAHIDGKFLKPAWRPPEEIRRDKPNLPDVIPGGTPENPMGVAAMTLNPGEYAIHGTNAPNSIGHYASYGCIRMHNSDIMDLYQRVDVGARVVVLR
jgi:lipoprotein-anchoring transpeptidase ErfK/SrfK